MSNESPAVVLLSGGLDSATVLAMAKDHGHACYSLSFDYGQRHRAELDAAARVSAALGAREHRVERLDLGNLGASALTDTSIAVPEAERDAPEDEIPITYVPARNTVMLAHALAWAEVLEADVIYIGVTAVDYSGYPDCRPEFIEAFARMAQLATARGVGGHPFEIRTPLIQLSKAEIIQAGHALGVDYALTVSCYSATDAGEACGVCDSCSFRRRGFEEAGLADPTRYAGA